MMWQRWRWLLGVVLMMAILVGSRPSLAQFDPTATPDAEGIIYVVVQPNDSLWAIAARAGISLQELLTLNNLTEDSVVQPGDLLIVGQGEPPASPTSEQPTPLPTPVITPTPELARTALCVAAFDDGDRDGVVDSGEPWRSGVAFTIYNDDVVVANIITDGSGFQCADGLAAGTYFITRSVGREEVLTTDGNWAATLVTGTVLEQAFGSYTGPPSTAAPAPTLAATITPFPTPTSEPLMALPQVNSPSNVRVAFIAGLMCLCMIVLLLCVGVLMALLGYRRRGGTAQTTNQSVNNSTEH